ncbi:hypothetical protein ACUN24_04230 [Pedobacter sp. WC2501]|uniref:hypothetical protein n=1 Tax=Pedobacter sp. WC2501 TaxID=3461400 RepID=UPI0040466A6A
MLGPVRLAVTSPAFRYSPDVKSGATAPIGFRYNSLMPVVPRSNRPFMVNLTVAGIPIFHRDKADGRAKVAKNYCSFISKYPHLNNSHLNRSGEIYPFFVKIYVPN